MSDIFISYAREDESRAKKLAKKLGKGGWKIFVDQTIPVGKRWRGVIARELKYARCVIVLWSKASIVSDWVWEEADHARKRDILFPVLIENVQPPMPFGGIQAADLVNWDATELSQAFRILRDDIAALIGPPPEEVAEQSEARRTAMAARRRVQRSAGIAASPGADENRRKGRRLPDKFTLPRGYADLRADCERFFADYPHYDRNVFIMTRFDDRDQLLRQLDEQLRKALCRHGLVGVRAGDRMYPSDGQLWKNVCVYMVCCKYGVAVLEDRAKDEFNPNVALEYGFMRALDKPTLLLTDRGIRNLRADIVGSVREQLDIADLAGTLASPIERWIRSLGTDLKAGRSELQQQALKAHRRLMNIKCAQFVRDDAQRKKEEDDEFWYFGEEIENYRRLLVERPNADHKMTVEDAQLLVAGKHDFTAVDGLINRFAELAR